MIHATDIAPYAGSHSDLARELGDLRYDALALLLRELAAKPEADAKADAGRKRGRLGGELGEAAGAVHLAAEAIERAWTICKPRIRD